MSERKRDILVVDDDRELTKLIPVLLKDESPDYEVTVANDPDEAKEILATRAKQPFTAIFLDLRFHQGGELTPLSSTGVDLLRNIRSND